MRRRDLEGGRFMLAVCCIVDSGEAKHSTHLSLIYLSISQQILVRVLDIFSAFLIKE